MNFPTLLKTCRKKAKLTQKELGDKLHMSQHTISQYETGARSIDSTTLQLFIDFFEIQVAYDTNRILTKHTDSFDTWNKEWQTLLHSQKEYLQSFAEEERRFMTEMKFTDAHWFDEEDNEEGFHVSLVWQNESFCIQRNDVYLSVTHYPALSKDVFSEESLFLFENLLEHFSLEERIEKLYE